MTPEQVTADAIYLSRRTRAMQIEGVDPENPPALLLSVLRKESDAFAKPAVAALRAAGLLPGPDDIVVNRKVADKALGHAWAAYDEATANALRAALSQPHPAQEQQP